MDITAFLVSVPSPSPVPLRQGRGPEERWQDPRPTQRATGAPEAGEDADLRRSDPRYGVGLAGL